MKTRKNSIKKITKILLSGVIIISIINCSGGKKSEPSNTLSNEAKLDKEELKKEVGEVVYPLPTTFEVTEKINEIEASFIIGLTNNLSNVDKYFTEKDQAINLGVYSADLSYASTYNMQQEVMSYMEASEILIKELGITGAFTQDFVDEVEANIDNKEVLIELITNSFYDTYEYLVKNNKEDLSLLVLSGSWIEGMYISCNISETVYHNPELIKVIMNQKVSLDKLIDLLKAHLEIESVKSIFDDLSPIKEIYNKVDEKGITESQVKQIIEKVNALRSKIIS